MIMDFQQQYCGTIKGSVMRVIFMILISGMIGCTKIENLETAKEKVKHQNEKLEQVVITKNTDLLKEVYADSAYFMSPGEGVVRGRDSIIVLWKTDLDRIVEMKSTSLEVNGSVDCLFEVGIVENKIRSAVKDTITIHRAKYNNVWIRQPNGEYRLMVDIFNRMN
jgi:ketosteroid isomerase-like protein